MSVLLVNADLSQPGVDGQNLDLVAFSELVHLPHFSFVFGRPVHVALKYVQAVGMSEVWGGGGVKTELSSYFCFNATFVGPRSGLQVISRVPTSRNDDLPLRAVRLNGLDDVLFCVAPVDPVSVQVVHDQPSGPAQLLLVHQHLPMLTVHPRRLDPGLLAPVSPVQHPAQPHMRTKTSFLNT